MPEASKYIYKDYTERYESIMQFNKNKSKYIHGWYPFVEGYSKDFIVDTINELPSKPTCCLDPFAGSGTTPMELQKMKVKCFSFEVNPFMYNLAKVKMRTDYTVRGFNRSLSLVISSLENYVEDIESVINRPIYGRITERDNLEKWNFNIEVLKGLLDIKYALSQLKELNYKDLFKIALASILLDVSNVYRNGKTYSYKDDWKETVQFSRTDVHKIFIERIKASFSPDIKKLNKYRRLDRGLFSNNENCIFGDCREKLELLEDNSIDLVITSPPYLNSRDYTDTYMIELWMLDHITDYESLRELRRRTLRSHVQVNWENVVPLQISELEAAVNRISEHQEQFWNDGLLDMINGYFDDLNTVFELLYKKMVPDGVIYFNVANSAYYGVEIETDKIVAKIAEDNGFTIKEIRRARKIKPSSQQKDLIPFLWEVILVISKEAD